MAKARSLFLSGILAIGLIAVVRPASAACPYSFSTSAIINGSTADATPVSDNFNYIINCPDFLGKVGIGTTTPGGANPYVKLHVYFGSSGIGNFATGVDGNFSNEIIETDANGGLAFVMPNAGNAGIIVADPASSRDGAFFYNHASGWIWQVNGNSATAAMQLTTSGNLVVTGGNVGIGTATPGYALEVNGTAYATGAAGALSDRRHKKDIRPLSSGALGLVVKLKPVSFLWNDPKDDGMKGQQLGFIAQDIQKVIPSVIVTEPNKEKTLGLKYNEFIPILTKAIQEQEVEINELKEASYKQAAASSALIRKLSKDIEILKAKITYLQRYGPAKTAQSGMTNLK